MLNTLEEAITLVNKAEETLSRARMILVRYDIDSIKAEPYKLLEEASKDIQAFFTILKKEA